MRNAAFLIEHAADVVFRQPLIPGFNDSLTNIEATAKFLSSLGENAVRLQLMPYHRMGRDKYRALNREYDMEGLGMMENEELEVVKNAYLDCGVDCSISSWC
jgi:pyruvate formate lyase activating enzyme